MIDRALKSDSVPYELAIRNSVPQLEAEISTNFHEGGSIFDPLLFLYLLRLRCQNLMAYLATAPYNKL